MAFKDVEISGEKRMQNICNLCRGKMKKIGESGNVFVCENCNHIEYMT